jgi:hypothetical protein
MKTSSIATMICILSMIIISLSSLYDFYRQIKIMPSASLSHATLLYPCHLLLYEFGCIIHEFGLLLIFYEPTQSMDLKY